MYKDFLEFAELRTECMTVWDPKASKPAHFVALRLIAFRPVGHPDGDRAVLPTVFVSEHQFQPLLEQLAVEIRTHLQETSRRSGSEPDSGTPPPQAQH